MWPKKSWDCKSNPSSYYSTLEIFPQEEDAPVQLEIPLLQQQFLQRPAIDFVSSVPVDEENSIVVQDQKVENKEDNECVEGDSFPLCYASFELLRHLHKISKQAKKLEDMTFPEIENEGGK